MPVPAHIHSPNDLLTTPADIVRGFRAQARLKRGLANPMVQLAFQFLQQLNQAVDIAAVVQNAALKPMLLAAAGYSQKAINNLAPAQVQQEAHVFLNSVHAKDGDSWKEEIAFRYLLTLGDTVGGQSRNVIGGHAKNKLARIIRKAALAKFPGHVQILKPGNAIKSIVWPNRVLLFDRRSPLVKKNIDVILLDATEAPIANLLSTPSAYLSCGELKGGIDPAGADEHWKTAISALSRVKTGHAPNTKLFYVGAIIDGTLSAEMYARMQAETLDYAANLHSKPQMEALANWLLGL